ncbi:MAG: ATP-binding protein [Candidatus Omnitrophica bacterium]|nr:ATP-binding protein [Candidatus Omnitrophota bacterium]
MTEALRTKLQITNDSRLLKKASRELIDILKDRGIGEETLFDVQAGFEEALRNAMLHGNRLHPDKKVIVETEITFEQVTISVEDEGEGFDPDSLPDPTLEENLLKESGRGIYLIRHLMDRVRYENGGRRVVMTKYLKKRL